MDNREGGNLHIDSQDLIAPCGMNCSLCIAYQFRILDINKQGFHRRYCPGCIARGENCTHMADACENLGKGSVRFCIECEDYPCKRLKALDKRYRTEMLGLRQHHEIYLSDPRKVPAEKLKTVVRHPITR